MHQSFAERFNDEILAFVNRPENQVLRPGTGSYSTPFRGSLFGEVDARKVDAELRRRGGIDVLWMGSNPNAPDSLVAILGAGNDRQFPDSFVRQRDSGMYSEQRPNGEPGWDPIHHPSTRGWQLYNKLISEAADIDSVAMANFLVWGSANFNEFLSRVAAMDRPLLDRVLSFSVGLNFSIISVLKPQLIAIPFSLGRSTALRSVAPEYLRLGKHCRECKVPGLRKTFNFYLQDSVREIPGTRVLHVPHPSSLRLDVSAEQQVIKAIIKALE